MTGDELRQPYLGDVRGEPLLAPRSYPLEHAGELTGNRLLMLFAAVVLAVVLVSAFTFSTARGAVDEKQIRRDCTVDALKYCKVAMLTRRRDAIINCMVLNRDKLSAACSRHLW